MSSLLTLGVACTQGTDRDRTASSTSADRGTDGNTGDANSDRDQVASPVERTDGPAAAIDGEMAGGNGTFLAEPAAPELDAAGYTQHEYQVSGKAIDFQPSAGPDAPLPADGRFQLVARDDPAAATPGAPADYRTRIVVRRPQDRSEFNGTVIVEWLNVSGGLDANPDYSFMADEITRGGYVWVGVSAQRIGVEGGQVAVSVPIAGALAGKGLKALDPERYGKLTHPGDQYAYDIFTQVGRLLRSQTAAMTDGPLGGLTPGRLLAVGESQSGFALTTYVNGVQPLAGQFDGFFIHSRGASPLPLRPASGADIDIASAISGTPTRIRTDQSVPVLVFQTESDIVGIINYLPARQDDSEHFRLWEVAGTAHADAFLLGPIADQSGCTGSVNHGPQHFAAKAALRALDRWVRTGEGPGEVDRLAVTGPAEPAPGSGTPAGATLDRDDLGMARGGLRLPQVSVPTEVNSGEPTPKPSVICMLLGSQTSLTPAQLGKLYESPADYTAKYERATDEAITAGHALPEDRAAILAEARPAAIG